MRNTEWTMGIRVRKGENHPPSIAVNRLISDLQYLYYLNTSFRCYTSVDFNCTKKMDVVVNRSSDL